MNIGSDAKGLASPGSSDDELSRLLEEELGEENSSPQTASGKTSIQDEAGPSAALKRKREDGQCPPHPGTIHGICFRCGQRVAEHAASSSVALRYIHQGLQLSKGEADRVRSRDLDRVLEKKKLILVLDLDHTLLNSTGINEIGKQLQPQLDSFWNWQHTQETQSLYRFQGLWTKLRPFVREFLEAAHEIAEMHVYTHGGREYANAMAKVLDPTKKYFKDRIISQADSTKTHVKDLDVMLGAESAVLILDDTPGMWPQHKDNLIQVERYIFFPADAKRLRTGASLLEGHKEESKESGQLAVVLSVLKELHALFYNDAGPKDVRVHLKSKQQQILQDVVIVFSSVIPQNLPNPQDVWVYQLALQLGAKVVVTLDEGATHVVSAALGTQKVLEGQRRALHVVSVEWLIASGFLWRRMDEKQFPVRSQHRHEIRTEQDDAALAAQAAGGGVPDSAINPAELDDQPVT